jgi:hypothetical protein
MAFSVGHIIGALKDYDLLEKTLGQFVQTLEPKFDISQAVGSPKEGKGPPELKLYLAALSCCYDVKVLDIIHPEFN